MEFLTEAEANAYAEKCPPRTRVYEMPEVKSRGPADTPKLPTDAQERKGAPIFRGVLMYFPDAIAEVARLSHAATQQHHPDKPMHWDKSKSTDEEDALVRHLMERGTLDTDGQRHSAKAAWRALAMLQREIEAEREPINGADKLGMNGANPSSNGRVPCPCKLRDCLVADGVDMKYAYCVRGKDLPEAAVKHDPFAGGT